MRESMTLIDQANIFNKTHHQNLIFDRFASKNNVDVFTSRPFISPTKQTKSHRLDKFTLPPIDDNRPRRRTRRPAYRTSIYHSNTFNSSHLDLSILAARGKKPEIITPIKDEETVMNFQRHHAPPPSPSDDQVIRILSEMNRTRQSTPETPTQTDGNIPYRLPALHQSAKRRQKSVNLPAKDIKSTLSNYLQTYY